MRQLPSLPTLTTRESSDSFTVAVACGPYTADADLKYEPWKQLLTKWKEEKPEVIVLVRVQPFKAVSTADTSIR